MLKYFVFLAAALSVGAGIALDWARQDSQDPAALARQVGEHVGKELADLRQEAKFILRDSGKVSWSSLSHAFLLVEDDQIVAWSTNAYSINPDMWRDEFEVKLVQWANQDLLLVKWNMARRHALVGILPLRRGYVISNRYLTTEWNHAIFPTADITISPVGSDIGQSVCVGAEGCLFRIAAPDRPFHSNVASTALVGIAILALLVGIVFVVRDLSRRSEVLAFLALFTFLALIRILMVEFAFPGRWIYSRYFDPKYFASASFNASAGDFFFNALIVLVSCAYLFTIYPRIRWTRAGARPIRWLAAVVLLTGAYFAFLFPHLFVESIFHDSAIPFDVTSVSGFDGLRFTLLLTFAMGAISSFFVVHVFIRWTGLAQPLEFLTALLVAATLFSLYFVSAELDYWLTLGAGSLYFLALYSFHRIRLPARLAYGQYSILMLGILAYGAQGALDVRRFAEEKKVVSMLRLGANLISKDELAEYLLNDAATRMENDERLLEGLRYENGAGAVRRRIVQNYLNRYLNRYEVKINLYDAQGKPADPETSPDWEMMTQWSGNPANQTGFDGVFLVRGDDQETVRRYLTVIPVRGHGSVAFVILDLSLKRIIPRQVYPELLVDNRFSQSLRDKDFSYVFFNQRKPTTSFGNFNFEKDFDPQLLTQPSLFKSGVRGGSMWFVGTEDENGQQVVVASPAYPWFSVLANFAFLFVLGLTVFFVARLFLFLKTPSTFRVRFNYAARIQIYSYLSFMVPLVMVSVVTLRLISQSTEVQLEKEIQDKGLQVSESVAVLLDGSMDSLTNPATFQNQFSVIAQNAVLDANVYAPTGALLASSQPAIFKDQLIMPLPDRPSWERIVVQKFNSTQAHGRIGLLDYNSSFFVVKSPATGKVTGILELPFFESSADAARIDVLSNILVTFTGVFILFSLLVANAARQLTWPLRFIAKKLKTTTLENNQPIEWTRNDEIGLMVDQYNRMLANLEVRKMELMRAQKESAWREIAQQVAHEIKNPLTPIKLTLQQLEQAISRNDLSPEKIQQSLKLVLTQVEILNGIAGSFSAFASLPAPQSKPLAIHTLLADAVLLFQNNPNCVVTFADTGSVQVWGDEQLVPRIFSNLILNAIQSGDGKPVQVTISIQDDPEDCVIRVRDDGAGIAVEFQQKVFLPHFSTKSTGSGLGLAISKQALEQMGGAIWFETTPGRGTTFFVRLRKA